MTYAVGTNAPGYMPESPEDVTIHPTFEDAFFALCAELVKTREALYDDADSDADERLDAATCEASEAAKLRQPFTIYYAGLAHWIEPAECEKATGEKRGQRRPGYYN